MNIKHIVYKSLWSNESPEHFSGIIYQREGLEAPIHDGKFCTMTSDKRKAFRLEIVIYLPGNISEQPAYGNYISQVIWYAMIYH